MFNNSVSFASSNNSSCVKGRVLVDNFLVIFFLSNFFAFIARSRCRFTVSTVLLTVEARVSFLPTSDDDKISLGLGPSFCVLKDEAEGVVETVADFFGFSWKRDFKSNLKRWNMAPVKYFLYFVKLND